MTYTDISFALNNIHIGYVQEAATHFCKKVHPVSIRRFLMFAAIIAVTLCLCAFSLVCFSTFSGDNLVLNANYAGEGIVLATVKNQSDKDLTLEPTVKLLYYSTNTPVETTGADAEFTSLTIPANSTQTIRIDLRLAYDVEALENLTNELICLQLTNKGFTLGQRWTTTLSFRPSAGEYVPQYQKSNDMRRAESVIPSLRSYFENYTPDLFARWADVRDYLELVEAELGQIEGNIVAPIDPLLSLDCSAYPTHCWSSCFDGYNKLLGRTDMEKISLVELHVPRLLNGELNGTQTIPIFYLWKFSVADIQSPDDYAFIRGNLLTFREMEAYKVYEDSQYVVYEMHHLIYSDLRSYVEEMLIQNDSIYFDDAIWRRIQDFYDKYSNREYMRSCFYLPEKDSRQRIPLKMDDVLSLAESGANIEFASLKPYHRVWKDIDDPNGYGLSFEIDGNYEFFYSLHADGTLNGYFLYHYPTGDKIDIRWEDVSAFIATHGTPLPRCDCRETENSWHGWKLSLEWLSTMPNDCIISRYRNVCYTRIEDGDLTTYRYPVDDERFYVEVSWNPFISGIADHTDENVYLIHNDSGDRCNVRSEDVAAFVAGHS